MRTSKKGIELIKQLEGFSKKAYMCSANKLTIGYGHVIKDIERYLEVQNISQEQAEELLKEDINRFEDYLNKIIKEYNIELNQNQFDALISFVFNTGYFKEAMLARLKGNKLIEVGNALPMYNKAGGEVLSGLTKRRKKEQELFFS